jgi:ubiquinone/menaquinone biosynthesis C-methylase UbiE
LAETQPKDFSEETHWEKAAKTRMGKYLTQMETRFIHNSVNLSHANAIMDIGAEAGRFSQVSTDKEATVVSIDINSYGLKRLHLKTKQVNVIQADARKIPFKDQTFDIIFMVETLDYIPELNEALAEIHRTLKPEASLILSFGNKSSLKSKLRELRGKSYMHSYQSVMHSLLIIGFTVKRKMGYSWLPFGRTSQNRLVPLLAFGERILALRRIPTLSPWIMVHAVKRCSIVQ